MHFDDTYYMRIAMQEAEKAKEAGEIPVGAVVVCGDKIIAKAHNQVEKLKDATAHAEMLAITAAMAYMKAKYLEGCTVYVTLEPCPMCAGALYWARPSRVVYAATDELRGFKHQFCRLHPQTALEQGILAEEAAEKLKAFFKQRRR